MNQQKEFYWLIAASASILAAYAGIFTLAQATRPASQPTTAPTTAPATQPSVAVITQLETNVTTGQGVEVNALSSTINSGSWLNATFAWDFGDPGSQYNNLPGWNAGHIYVYSGTYDITLTLTDLAGSVSVAKTQVLVQADTRTVIYVDALTGNDRNQGDSPGRAVKTAVRAFSLAGSNSRIRFHRGQVFPVPTTLWVNGHDQAIDSYGTNTTASPVLMFAPADGSEAVIFVGQSCYNTTITGLIIDSPNQVGLGPANELNIFAVWAGGSNLAVNGCTFKNVGDAVNATVGCNGVIIQNCSAPLIKGMRGYLAWGGGHDWSILGNTVVNSTRAHCVRVNDPSCVGVLVAFNNLTKQYPADDPGEAVKDTVDVRIGSYVWVAKNILLDSPCSISPSPGQTANQIVNWSVWDTNSIQGGQLIVDEVGRHVMLRNNSLTITGTGQIEIVPTGNTVPGAQLTDITVTQNTGTNNTATGEFIDVFAGAAPASIVLTGNVFVAPNLAVGANWTSGIHIESDLTAFSVISGNTWPAPNAVQLQGVVNLVKGQYFTPNQWLGLPNVSGDKFTN